MAVEAVELLLKILVLVDSVSLNEEDNLVDFCFVLNVDH
jgi:hypothetical protein